VQQCWTSIALDQQCTGHQCTSNALDSNALDQHCTGPAMLDQHCWCSNDGAAAAPAARSNAADAALLVQQCWWLAAAVALCSAVQCVTVHTMQCSVQYSALHYHVVHSAL